MRSRAEIEADLIPLLTEYLGLCVEKKYSFQGALFELSWPIEHNVKELLDEMGEEENGHQRPEISKG